MSKTKFSTIQNQPEFENLCKGDVLFSLSAAYPMAGAITCNDILTLERASSQTDPESAKRMIADVFESIKARAEEIKLANIRIAEKQQSSAKEEADNQFVNVQQLKVLY